MKCNYCGKRFPTAQLDREMFRNESWGTPYHYAKNDIFNDEIVTAAGFDPEDSDNMLCPDCVDKIYDAQKEYASEKYKGDNMIKIKSSRCIFSRLILQKFNSYAETPSKFNGTAYINVIKTNGGSIKDFGYNDTKGAQYDLFIKFRKPSDKEGIYRTLMIKDSIGTWKCAYGNDVVEGKGSVDFQNKIF